MRFLAFFPVRKVKTRDIPIIEQQIRPVWLRTVKHLSVVPGPLTGRDSSVQRPSPLGHASVSALHCRSPAPERTLGQWHEHRFVNFGATNLRIGDCEKIGITGRR